MFAPEMRSQKLLWFNRSDGRVVRASEAVDMGLMTSQAKPMTKNWYSQLPCLTLSTNAQCGE